MHSRMITISELKKSQAGSLFSTLHKMWNKHYDRTFVEVHIR